MVTEEQKIYDILYEGKYPYTKREKKNISELLVFQTSRLEIGKELEAIDKTKVSGPDEISWSKITQSQNSYESHYTVFKNSLQEGKLPESWKKSNRQDPLKSRPASLTSVVCKIIKKIIEVGLSIWKKIR